MPIAIEQVTEASEELVAAVARLLPQLSNRATAGDELAIARLLTQPGVNVLVARTDGEITGMLTLTVQELFTGVRAHIEDVVVEQATRGSGVGTALIEAALSLAKQRGAASVDLTSRPARVEANRLYRSLGFQPRESQVYRYPLESP